MVTNITSTTRSYQVYGYRWVILVVFMLINVTLEIQWICFAPVTGPAAQFYGVTDLQIGLLAMLFMFVYIPLSIPVSWMIDTMGYQKAVGIGAVLLAVSSVLRAALGATYTGVLIGTIGLAVAQPFLMNAVSTVAARWFPMNERATAAGLGMVAGFIGIGLGQVFSPILVTNYGFLPMLWIFGIIAVASVVVFLVFTRDAPPTPPCPPGQETRALMLDGLKTMLKMRDIWLLLVLFLVGMGIFNGVATWIEDIVRPRGYTPIQAGQFGGILLLGGIIGSIIIPALSDRAGKRKNFLLVCMVLALPGLIGITFATSYGMIMISMAVMGFFLMSMAPIGYQYAAEITYPAPEGTSNGLLNLAGQTSVIFILAMAPIKDITGTFTTSLIILIVFMAICSVLVALLHESQLIGSRVQTTGD